MIIKTAGTQKEAQIVDIAKKPNAILRYDIDYDTLHPEEVMRKFVADVKEMLARYDYVSRRITEIENEMSDIEHYMEISPYKTVAQGYKLYKQLATLRKERRACKDEKILLQNVYNRFKETDILNKVSICQGECAKGKSYIDSQVYAVRTDTLDEWLEKPEKKESVVKLVEDIQEQAEGTEKTEEKLSSLKEVM